MIENTIKEIINKTKGKKLSSDLLFDGGFVKVYKEQYQLPEGKIISKEKVSKNNDKEAAIVITRTIDDKYLIVFQNRVDNNVSAEFPSGYIEKGEDVLEAAKREVLEETGYSIKKAILIDTFIPNIGTENTKIHIVYGKEAEKTQDQSLDEDEYINYYLFSFKELEYLINSNYIQSGGNKLAFSHLKEILNEEEK
jgi:ADP-ribose pyrophosphatase